MLMPESDPVRKQAYHSPFPSLENFLVATGRMVVQFSQVCRFCLQPYRYRDVSIGYQTVFWRQVNRKTKRRFRYRYNFMQHVCQIPRFHRIWRVMRITAQSILYRRYSSVRRKHAEEGPPSKVGRSGHIRYLALCRICSGRFAYTPSGLPSSKPSNKGARFCEKIHHGCR